MQWQVLRTPVHVCGARTREQYERMQAQNIQKLQARGMFVQIADAEPGATVIVTGGKWVVRCSCGNAPSASPEWDIARCFDCGLVYRNLVWPTDHDQIEAVLCARPVGNRHFDPLQGETLEVLIAQNIEAGDPSTRTVTRISAGQAEAVLTQRMNADAASAFQTAAVDAAEAVATAVQESL